MDFITDGFVRMSSWKWDWAQNNGKSANDEKQSIRSKHTNTYAHKIVLQNNFLVFAFHSLDSKHFQNERYFYGHDVKSKEKQEEEQGEEKEAFEYHKTIIIFKHTISKHNTQWELYPTVKIKKKNQIKSSNDWNVCEWNWLHLSLLK